MRFSENLKIDLNSVYFDFKFEKKNCAKQK